MKRAKQRTTTPSRRRQGVATKPNAKTKEPRSPLRDLKAANLLDETESNLCQQRSVAEISTQTTALEEQKSVVSGEALIKDLRKEDKRKIADLIKQLVQAGEVKILLACDRLLCTRWSGLKVSSTLNRFALLVPLFVWLTLSANPSTLSPALLYRTKRHWRTSFLKRSP